VHTRIIGPVTRQKDSLRALVQVRLIPNDHLELVIQGGSEDERFQVTLAVNGDLGSHHLLASPAGGLPVARPAFAEYHLLDEILKLIAEEPQRVREHVTRAVARIKVVQEDIYPAYLGLLKEVMAYSSDPDQLCREANSLRARLYDGPVVGAYSRQTLDRFFSSDEAYFSFTSQLTVHQRADLARMRMPLEQLKAREGISGFY
jgi:hypothetical protein